MWSNSGFRWINSSSWNRSPKKKSRGFALVIWFCEVEFCSFGTTFGKWAFPSWIKESMSSDRELTRFEFIFLTHARQPDIDILARNESGENPVGLLMSCALIPRGLHSFWERKLHEKVPSETFASNIYSAHSAMRMRVIWTSSVITRNWSIGNFSNRRRQSGPCRVRLYYLSLRRANTSCHFDPRSFLSFISTTNFALRAQFLSRKRTGSHEP